MEGLPTNISEKIREHLVVLELEKVGWVSKEDKVVEWQEKEMFFYGNPFLEIKMNTGITLGFSYQPSDGTYYCSCEEHSESYNHIHSCCGTDCDWEVPVIIKHNSDGSEEICVFTGKQKELWKFENVN